MTMPRSALTGADGRKPAEPYRPVYHFTPERNWMNDPNGLVWYDGEYHLFFQYNPYGTDWGHISWGHAVSPDLSLWRELPVALAATDAEYVFSGSVVVDHGNTSGLGGPDRPAMVGLYTSADPVTGRQSQSVAYSVDRGRQWKRYVDNPVLDIDSNDFRDPKVFYYDRGDHWVMAVALAVERVVRFYSSEDLLSWEHLSDFGPAGSDDGVWECPDLFPLPLDDDPTRIRWVLLVSVQDGAPAGGSGMQYFVGDFDGVRFTPQEDDLCQVRWVDHGADHYAAVSFSDAPDNERVVLGWMSNWNYAHDVPTGAFRGSMTLPRRYGLRTVDGLPRLVQQPVAPSAVPVHTSGPIRLVGERPVPASTAGQAFVVDAAFQAGTADRLGVLVRVGEGERTVVGYDAVAGTIYVDRRVSGGDGLPPEFAAVHHAPATEVGVVRLQIHVDACSVEVFAADGEVVLTDLIYPSPDSNGIAVFAEGGTAVLRSLEVSRVTSPALTTPDAPADAPRK